MYIFIIYICIEFFVIFILCAVCIVIEVISEVVVIVN